MSSATRFDREYYRRYYFDSRTAVTSPQEMEARAHFIAACAKHIGLPVKRMLDAGCGVGLMRKALVQSLPRAQYTGLETSDYLCQKFGWEQSSIEDYRVTTPFDLIVCYDVFQYLTDPQAQRGLANLGRLCRGLLFFSALTLEDWRKNCDKTRTDSNVHMRAGEWYRTRLRRSFLEIGAGFWLRRGVPLPMWELESVSSTARG